jgi:hypothetical protein
VQRQAFEWYVALATSVQAVLRGFVARRRIERRRREAREAACVGNGLARLQALVRGGLARSALARRLTADIAVAVGAATVIQAAARRALLAAKLRAERSSGAKEPRTAGPAASDAGDLDVTLAADDAPSSSSSLMLLPLKSGGGASGEGAGEDVPLMPAVDPEGGARACDAVLSPSAERIKRKWQRRASLKSLTATELTALAAAASLEDEPLSGAAADDLPVVPTPEPSTVATDEPAAGLTSWKEKRDPVLDAVLSPSAERNAVLSPSAERNAVLSPSAERKWKRRASARAITAAAALPATAVESRADEAQSIEKQASVLAAEPAVVALSSSGDVRSNVVTSVDPESNLGPAETKALSSAPSSPSSMLREESKALRSPPGKRALSSATSTAATAPSDADSFTSPVATYRAATGRPDAQQQQLYFSAKRTAAILSPLSAPLAQAAEAKESPFGKAEAKPSAKAQAKAETKAGAAPGTRGLPALGTALGTAGAAFLGVCDGVAMPKVPASPFGGGGSRAEGPKAETKRDRALRLQLQSPLQPPPPPPPKRVPPPPPPRRLDFSAAESSCSDSNSSSDEDPDSDTDTEAEGAYPGLT